MSSIEAIFIDLGGVVLESPIHAITQIEEKLKLPKHSLNQALGLSPLFHQLEKGELSLQEFCPAFNEYLLHSSPLAKYAENLREFDIGAFIKRDIGSDIRIRPHFVRALKRLKSAGFKVIAVTNNWKNKLSDAHGAGFQFLEPRYQPSEQDNSSHFKALQGLFDGVVQSCVVGKRKPDTQIFEIALREAGVKDPSKVIFLDDILSNIKGAQKIGMQTIHVRGNGKDALALLSEKVGVNLLKDSKL